MPWAWCRDMREKERTYGCGRDVEITSPYHGLFLVQIADIRFEMTVPQFLRIKGLWRIVTIAQFL